VKSVIKVRETVAKLISKWNAVSVVGISASCSKLHGLGNKPRTRADLGSRSGAGHVKIIKKVRKLLVVFDLSWNIEMKRTINVPEREGGFKWETLERSNSAWDTRHLSYDV
jgi:hypothetical protein